MNVTLINPPLVYPAQSYSTGMALPPIGLAYVGAYLIEKNINVSVIDSFGEAIHQTTALQDLNAFYIGLRPKEIVKRIPENVDLIGVTSMFSSGWVVTRMLLNEIHSAFPDIAIVLGGEHATAEPERILGDCPFISAIVLGEGEVPMHNLCVSISNKSPLSEINGLALLLDKHIHITAAQKRISDFSCMPWPAWSLIPMSAYLDAGFSVTNANVRSIPILGSRGCPFACTFCTSPNMWGQNLIFRNPKDIVNEIRHNVSVYKINHVDFCDIVGAFKRSWFLDLLQELINADLPVSWMFAAGTRSEILDPEILQLMKKSKVLKIHFAPETGSKKTIELIGKKLDLKKVVTSMQHASKIGIITRAMIIIGIPGQSWADILSTGFFCLKLALFGTNDININIYTAYPGSKLYKSLYASGVIDNIELRSGMSHDKFLVHSASTVKLVNNISWNDKMPGWALNFTRHSFHLAFYMIQFLVRPKRVFSTFYRVYTNRPITLIEHFIFFNLKKIRCSFHLFF